MCPAILIICVVVGALGFVFLVFLAWTGLLYKCLCSSKYCPQRCRRKPEAKVMDHQQMTSVMTAQTVPAPVAPATPLPPAKPVLWTYRDR